MNLSNYKRIVFSLAASALLLAGLILLMHGTSRIARAAPGDLFVTTGVSGVICTQANPCDLATALNQSTDGDTICLAQGIYTSADEADRGDRKHCPLRWLGWHHDRTACA